MAEGKGKKAGLYLLATGLEKKAEGWADRLYEKTGKKLPLWVRYLIAGIWDVFDVLMLILVPLSWIPVVGIIPKAIMWFLNYIEVSLGIALAGRYGLVFGVTELLDDAIPGGHVIEAILPVLTYCVWKSTQAEKEEGKAGSPAIRAAKAVLKAASEADIDGKSPVRAAGKALDNYKEGKPDHAAAERIVSAIESNPDDPMRAAKAEFARIAAEEKTVATTTTAKKEKSGGGVWTAIFLILGTALGATIILPGVGWTDFLIFGVVVAFLAAPIGFFWPKIKPWLVDNGLWKEEVK